jgi:hypothetical protein
LGLIDDFWYRWVADVGITGADKGKGGKYLVLPPGYQGQVPDGYSVVRASTYGNWLVFRSFLVDGSTKPGVESVKANLKIYPLADAANPPAMKFVKCFRYFFEFCFFRMTTRFGTLRTKSFRKNRVREAIRRRWVFLPPSAS